MNFWQTNIPNRKGQASITDALFFLSIIAIISVMLFGKGLEYGQGAEERLQDVYKTKYTINALKTIMNSSATRDGKTFEQSKDIDYYLTIVKEEYYKTSTDGYFTNSKLISSPVIGIMEPYESSFDYIYYIYNRSTEEFMFFIWVATDFESTETKPEKKTIVGEKDISIKGKTMYVCKPSKTQHLELLSSVGEVSQSSNVIQLTRKKQDSYLEEKIKAEIGLSLWISAGAKEEQITNMQCACIKRKISGEWEDCQ